MLVYLDGYGFFPESPENIFNQVLLRIATRDVSVPGKECCDHPLEKESGPLGGLPLKREWKNR